VTGRRAGRSRSRLSIPSRRERYLCSVKRVDRSCGQAGVCSVSGTWRLWKTTGHRVMLSVLRLYVALVAWNLLNTSKPNDHYSGRTAPLTSKRCILYIYSTNIGTEYFKNGIYSQFFFFSKCGFFHNSNVFGSCIIHILYIYSTNIGTEYFKHGIYSPVFSFKM